MNADKLRSRIRLAAGAAALLLAVPAAMAQTVDGRPQVKAEVLESVTNLLKTNAFVPGLDFHQWEQFLEADRTTIDLAKDDDEFVRAVNQALQKFGASHIVLSSPKAAETRRTSQTVGIGITSQTTDEGVLIIRVVPGAPADKAGLVPGDVIYEVDGKPAEGIRGIPGQSGTKVTLGVRRGDGTTRDFTLTRAPFSTKREEELSWIDKDTAKLNVYTFDLTYSRENVDRLMDQASKAKNLILDLRDNGGGAVINLQHLMGHFIPADRPVGTFIGRQSIRRYVEATNGDPMDLAAVGRFERSKLRPFPAKNGTFKGNVVVLVNGFSGSASEIAAAALRDTIGATVIGKKSAGAVLVSVIVPTSHGFTLQYPLSDYVTINGLRLEGNGVQPDIEADEPRLRLPNAADECVIRATETFSRLTSQRSGTGN